MLAGALPAVLDRMVAAFGLRAALAFQPSGGRTSGGQPSAGTNPAVLAVHPPGAADQALLARIGVLSMAQRDSAPGPLAVTLDGRPGSVLMARSVPVAGQCLCALALIGDAAAGDDGYWDAEIRATAHGVAAIVATQIRHANDIATLERSHAELADQTERLNCLISSAIPGVLITDELGTVTNASQSFGIMFGLDGPLAGTRGAAVPLTEEQLSCRDGRTVEWDYWPVLVNGRHRGDIWLAWDMSDRKELERQRVEAQRQLAEQNEGEAEGLTPEGSGSWTSSSATPTGCTGWSVTCSCWTGSRPARCRWTWPRSRSPTWPPRRSGRPRRPPPSRASPSRSAPGTDRSWPPTTGG